MNKSGKKYLSYHEQHSNCMSATGQSAISELTEQNISGVMDATNTTNHYQSLTKTICSLANLLLTYGKTVEHIVSTLSETDC